MAYLLTGNSSPVGSSHQNDLNKGSFHFKNM
jgi:hypothetical protein